MSDSVRTHRNLEWWISFLWLSFLSLLDAALTRIAIVLLGATELNPIMAKAIEFDWNLLWLIKVLTILGSFILLKTKHILFLILCYSLVIIWSISNMYLYTL